MRTPILILMSAIGVIGANSLLLSPVVTAVSQTLNATTAEVMRAASAYGLGVAAAALLLAPLGDRIGAGRAAARRALAAWVPGWVPAPRRRMSWCADGGAGGLRAGRRRRPALDLHSGDGDCPQGARVAGAGAMCCRAGRCRWCWASASAPGPPTWQAGARSMARWRVWRCCFGPPAASAARRRQPQRPGHLAADGPAGVRGSVRGLLSTGADDAGVFTAVISSPARISPKHLGLSITQAGLLAAVLRHRVRAGGAA